MRERSGPVGEQLVGEQHRERLIAHMAGGRADGMTETEWRALPSEVERRQIGDVTHGAEHLALPLARARSSSAMRSK